MDDELTLCRFSMTTAGAEYRFAQSSPSAVAGSIMPIVSGRCWRLSAKQIPAIII
jgi:hypothetical protein